MKYGSRSTEKMQMVSFYVVWVSARCAENVNKIHDSFYVRTLNMFLNITFSIKITVAYNVTDRLPTKIMKAYI